MTIRTLMVRFTRLSLGFSKKLEDLEAAVRMFMAYYTYCWRTRLTKELGQYRVPAAMAAGMVKNLWNIENLYEEVTVA